MTTTSAFPTARQRPQPQRPGPQQPGPQQASPARRWRTPDKLRLAIAASIVCSLLIGGFGLWLGLRQAALLGGAAARTEQAITLLEVQTNLTLANATTTNAFLVGGLEPSDLRLAADESFQAGATALAASTGDADVADGSALARTSAEVATYAGLIEQARAANRQGFPVGAAYLDQATTLLGEQVLPVVDDAVVATTTAAAGNFNEARGMVWLTLVLLVPLGALLAIQVWLSRVTRRRFNVPFVVGTAVVVLTGIFSVGTLQGSGAQADRVRSSTYVQSLALGQALSDAAQARSDEAFTLIRRGSGAAFETSFQDTIASARSHLDRGSSAPGGYVFSGLRGSLTDWVDGHAQIRELDDAGDWDAAVALATSRDDESPSALYQSFADDAGTVLADLSSSTTSQLRTAGSAGVIAAWLLAVAGVLCAWLSARGLNARLQEYQ